MTELSGGEGSVAMAECLRRERRFDEGSKIASDVSDRDPGNAEALVVLGRIELDRSNNDNALAYVDEAIERDPSFADAYAWRIAALCRLRRFADADSEAERARRLFPADPNVLVAIGRSHGDQDRLPDALLLFAEAIASDPTSTKAREWHISALRELRRFDDAETAARSAIEELPTTAALHVEMGWIFDDRYQYDDALTWYDRALDIDPRNVDAAVWRTITLRALRRFDEADAAAGAAIEQRPNEPRLLLQRGEIEHDLGRDEKALGWFDRALEVAPDDPSALEWRITALRRLRRYDDAEAACAMAIERWPDEPNLVMEMGYNANERARYEDALRWFDRALELDPTHIGAQIMRPSCLRSLHRFDEAEAAARHACEQRPDRPSLLVTMGISCAALERYDDALSWFDRALEQDPLHAQALEWRLIVLRGLRRYDEATSEGVAAIEKRPDQPELVVELGLVQDALGRYEEALGWFDRALEVDQHDVSALTWRVTALRRLRRFDQAANVALDACERSPDEFRFPLALGHVFADQGRHDEALTQYDRALEVDPLAIQVLSAKVGLLRRAHRFDDAERAVADAIARHPGEPDLFVEAGRVSEDRNRHQDALDRFESALEIDQRDTAARAWKIAVLRRMRRFDEAEETVLRAIEQTPGEPEFLVGAGLVADDQLNYDKALHWYDRTLEVDPRNANAWTRRISVLRRMGRYDDAETAGRDAIALRPDDPDLLVGIGWIFDDQRHYDKALGWYDRALELEPDNVGALTWRTMALRQLRRFDEAERTAIGAIELRPDTPMLLIGVGWLFDDLHRHSEAIVWYERALRVDPRNVSALTWKVTALRKLRRFDEADEFARSAIEEWPDQPEPFVELGHLCAERGDQEQALEWFDRALEINPLDPNTVDWRITTLRKLRRFAEAEIACRAAVEKYSAESRFHNELGWIFNAQHRYEEALDWFGRALDVDPRDDSALDRRIRILLILRRFDEAENAARVAVEELPREPALLVTLAKVLDHQLRYSDSLDCLDRALAIEADHPAAVVARSVALRSLRRFDEAERDIRAAMERMPWRRDLVIELVYIHHDQRNFDEATAIIATLRRTGVSAEERAEADAVLGDVRFAAGDYKAAEALFTKAWSQDDTEDDYLVGQAWSLTRQPSEDGWSRAAALCFEVIEREPSNLSAHICLGVLNYKRGRYAQAEHYLRRTLVLDSHHASRVDLGALLVTLNRFDEAETVLQEALDNDWYDAQAHVELGSLYLKKSLDIQDSGHGPDAVRHFRQALQIEPTNGSASLGLALALSSTVGDFVEAEEVLDRALQRPDCDHPRWQLLVAVARILVERGDRTQGSRQFYVDALAHAQEAISLAADKAEPYFIAAVARYRLAEAMDDLPAKPFRRRQALRDLRRCIKLDPGNTEARRSLLVMEQSSRITTASVTVSTIVVLVGMAVLGALWGAFFWSDRITTVMITTLTPVLIALIMIGLILPFVIRLKLPGGVEADLSASIRQISSGPTGEDLFAPGRFSKPNVSSGPQGQLPRRQ